MVDFRKLYARFVDPTTGLLFAPMPSHLLADFHSHCVMVTRELEEVERKRVATTLRKSLSVPSSRKTDYVFLTINFDPSKAFKDCFKAAQKLGNRSIWEWSCWVHEQRGETAATAGTGHHVHLLAKVSSQSTASPKTRAKTTVAPYCDVKNSAIFNWKYIPLEYIHDKFLYMTAPKALEKQVKQIHDKVWRSRNNISAIYYNNGPEAEKAIEEATPDDEGATLPESRGEDIAVGACEAKADNGEVYAASGI
jgi:hypothetical protein